MQKVESIRGKQKIMYNGYVYVEQKNLADGVISYECEKRGGSGAGLSAKQKLKLINKLYILPTTLLAWGEMAGGNWNRGEISRGKKGWGGNIQGENDRGEMSGGKCPGGKCPAPANLGK